LNALEVARGEDRLSVLLVGDDPLARRVIASELALEPSIQVVGQVSLGDEVKTIALDLQTEMLVVDLGLDARAGMARLRDLDLDTHLAVLLHDPDLATEAYRLGARGIFSREVEGARLASSLAAIARGLVVIDDSLATSLLGAPELGPVPKDTELTPREIEVLELLSRGLSNKSIAEALGISDHTAKFHVNAIMTKLGAETRTEAVVLAAKMGLVAL
jgi:DNA-binding NarL/FixJ family response regulator